MKTSATCLPTRAFWTLTPSLLTLETGRRRASYREDLSVEPCQSRTTAGPPSRCRPLGHPPHREERANVVRRTCTKTTLATRTLGRMATRLFATSTRRWLPYDLNIFGPTPRRLGLSAASTDEGAIYPRAARPLAVVESNTANGIVAERSQAVSVWPQLGKGRHTPSALPSVTIWKTLSACKAGR